MDITAALRRAGRTRWFARLGRAVSRIDKRIQKATDGRWSVLGRPTLPHLILTTTGRRSGEPRDAALLYARDGERWVVIGSNWGQQHHPAWSGNLLADPHAAVTVGGRRVEVVAHLADDDERARLLGTLRAIWPGYDDYDARTVRELRVFVLTPAVPAG
ncbi:nitroreductase/quinone reductase family protein [Cellulomonas chitinilytica]|uniref:nitroreductase/quinone reductase family protein n=1 Tax=Cellulomonas chitinilytica TaxID=398759 RepID=UPI0019452E3E|nr:nitroreductase/quinone reductase family protein [Cellulomonas chitinilytica]